jgi:hypothetical protein
MIWFYCHIPLFLQASFLVPPGNEKLSHQNRVVLAVLMMAAGAMLTLSLNPRLLRRLRNRFSEFRWIQSTIACIFGFNF